MKDRISVYMDIEDDVPAGASFEQRWYESVIVILTKIMNKRITPDRSNTLLLEICDGLCWVKHNLNQKLNIEHRNMLVLIFDICIKIIQGSIALKNVEYLEIVITSLRVVSDPYQK